MEPKFIHLRVHTEYSIRDGLVRIKPLIQKLASEPSPAVGMTDFCNLFGFVKFYRNATQNGIKPIIGADVLLKPEADIEPARVTFLCQNQKGYQNLTLLISKAYQEGQVKGVPYVDMEWLSGHTDGLLVLSGSLDGDIAQLLLKGKREQTLEALQRWQALFPERFYLEVTRTGKPRESEYEALALALASEFQVPVVATNDVRFLRRSDFEAHEARVCIHQGRVLEDDKREKAYTAEQYLRTEAEMCELFKDLPEALENSVEIAKRCNLHVELGKNYLPKYPIPEGETPASYLRQLSIEGLKNRFETNPNLTNQNDRYDEYLERLQIELDVIINMDFPGYFLVVADFIQWSKTNNIPVGPGRGSGAGSLVAYALGITDIDPIEFDLLFERFLNPERVSMPDFDVDFCMEGRDRVIQYVEERYGREKVSQIITYGTMAAKAVVRDVGRVLGHPYGFVDKIAKLIPFELGITLDKAIEDSEPLRERYEEEEDVAALIDLAKKLEGITRNAGKHAGGVVIAPTQLTDFAPLYCEEDGSNVVTQFDKDDVEAVGLVKFDFLGLRTLTIIQWALDTINARRATTGLEPIDINTIPWDDEKTFELIKAGNTTAVFQLESRGMKELILRLQPDCFEDIVALVALFRPGPLQSGMVDDFIDRKHGRAKVEYPHEALASILHPTYGVILYQEQVMQIAQVLAKYSLGGADLLRRAMGKKKPEEMAKQREIFLAGSKDNGVDTKVANGIFDLMEKFAGYGFNKSHSVAYAAISYQTAWLKAHYPAEFMAAVMSSDMDNTDKIVNMIDDAKKQGLKVMPPDIQKGFPKFTVSDEQQIEYGLAALKGVGIGAVESICCERQEQGAFKSISNFVKRLDMQKVNKRVLEALIRAGALDGFEHERSSMVASIPRLTQAAEQASKEKASGQMGLFAAVDAGLDDEEVTLVEAPPWRAQQRLQAEKETLGLYLTGHPLQAYQNELSRMTLCRIAELATKMNKTTLFCGEVIGTRVLKTRRGKLMAFLTLDDMSGRVDVVAFEETFEDRRHLIAKDRLILVEGEVSRDEYTGGYKVTAKSLKDLDEVRYSQVRGLRLHVSDVTDEAINRLKACLAPAVGGLCAIRLRFSEDAASGDVLLGNQWQVDLSPELLDNLHSLLGQDSVEYLYENR